MSVDTSRFTISTDLRRYLRHSPSRSIVVASLNITTGTQPTNTQE